MQGISGHADHDGLLHWFDSCKTKPGCVFVNHGDDDSCEGLARTLTDSFGIQASAPYSGAEFDLLKGEWIRLCDPVRKKQSAGNEATASAKKKESPYRDLMNAVQALKEYSEKMEEASNGEIRNLTKEILKLMES